MGGFLLFIIFCWRLSAYFYFGSNILSPSDNASTILNIRGNKKLMISIKLYYVNSRLKIKRRTLAFAFP